MTFTSSCPRETDVLDLVAIGQWPTRADAELVDHVRDCAICTDLATVAVAMAALEDAPMIGVRVPDPALVWYRAQVRGREDLARRAARPMLMVQVAAALCALAIGVIGWQVGSPSLAAWRDAITHTTLQDLVVRGESLWPDSVAGPIRWVLLAGLAWVVLLPAAIYLASLADRTVDVHLGPHGEPHADRQSRS